MTRTTTLSAALIAAAAFASVTHAQSDFSAERIKAHVTFLADDLLEGREAGTRGHEVATRYVATQFELMGVKPGGQGGGYFETVDLLEAAQTGRRYGALEVTDRATKLADAIAELQHGRHAEVFLGCPEYFRRRMAENKVRRAIAQALPSFDEWRDRPQIADGQAVEQETAQPAS